jgi:transposase InsO family protein
MRRELLDRHDWPSRAELAAAIFEWIQGWYNPRRRHTILGMLSPHEVRDPSHHHHHRGMITTERVRRTGSGSA